MAQRDDLDEILAQEFGRLDQKTEERAPTERQKISYFTVACLILNRTIGSGIFVTPRSVLLATGSVGISLLLWSLGAVVSICGLTVWNEFGLTVPLRIVPGGQEKSVPRSGGEKNYLEHLLQRPKFLATCMFGMAFLVLGNLSGNAVAFGSYVLRAAGYDDPPRSWNIAVAIAALTVACLVHVFSRRGGILLSNTLAVFKVCVLIAIIVIGFAVAGGAHLGPGVSHSSNLSVNTSFRNVQSDVSSYTFSFFYVLYSYSGFEQPFYVFSEVRQPRKVFPIATYSAMGTAAVLFVLVNIAYIAAIPLDGNLLEDSPDMATLFFSSIFGPRIAPRVMSAIIALCIYGNIIVMTFTASRVKQEIAKEGILPWSIFFATGHTTPDAWLRAKFRPQKLPSRPMTPMSTSDSEIRALEQTPMAALLLHWVMSLILIGVTAFLSAATAYFALVFLYSYVLIALIGFCVSSGLVYLHFSSENWHGSHGTEGFRPWGGPTAAIVYSIVSLFVLITAFLKPADGSPFAYEMTQIQWYILPAIGLSALLWGPIWWCGLHAYMRLRGLQLVVTRVPHIEQEAAGGEWVQRSEVIVRAWMSRSYVGALDKKSDSQDSGHDGVRLPDMRNV